MSRYENTLKILDEMKKKYKGDGSSPSATFTGTYTTDNVGVKIPESTRNVSPSKPGLIESGQINKPAKPTPTDEYDRIKTLMNEQIKNRDQINRPVEEIINAVPKDNTPEPIKTEIQDYGRTKSGSKIASARTYDITKAPAPYSPEIKPTDIQSIQKDIEKSYKENLVRGFVKDMWTQLTNEEYRQSKSRVYTPGQTVVGASVEKGLISANKGLLSTGRALSEKIGTTDTKGNPLKELIAGGANKVSKSFSMAVDSLDEALAKTDQAIFNKGNNIFIPETNMQKAVDQIKKSSNSTVDYENLPMGRRLTSDVISNAVRMIPLFIPGGGAAIFGAMAGGDYIDQAQKDGANIDQQLAYGTVGTAVETALTGWAVNGIASMFGKNMKDEIVKRGLKAALKTIAKDFAINAAKEGFEEFITDPIMGTAQKIIYDPNLQWFTMDSGEDAVVNVPNMAYSGLVGMISGGVLEAPSLPINVYEAVSHAKKSKEYIEQNYPSIVFSAMGLPDGYESKTMAEQMLKGEPTLADVEMLQETLMNDLNIHKDKIRDELIASTQIQNELDQKDQQVDLKEQVIKNSLTEMEHQENIVNDLKNRLYNYNEPVQAELENALQKLDDMKTQITERQKSYAQEDALNEAYNYNQSIPLPDITTLAQSDNQTSSKNLQPQTENQTQGQIEAVKKESNVADQTNIGSASYTNTENVLNEISQSVKN